MKPNQQSRDDQEPTLTGKTTGGIEFLKTSLNPKQDDGAREESTDNDNGKKS